LRKGQEGIRRLAERDLWLFIGQVLPVHDSLIVLGQDPLGLRQGNLPKPDSFPPGEAVNLHPIIEKVSLLILPQKLRKPMDIRFAHETLLTPPAPSILSAPNGELGRGI